MPRGISGQRGKDADWLKEKCRELVKRHKIVDFLAQVANGESVEQAVGNQGEVISVPAAVRDRIKATELLLDRGFGKPDQQFDVVDLTQRPNRQELETALASLRSVAKGIGLDKS